MFTEATGTTSHRGSNVIAPPRPLGAVSASTHLSSSGDLILLAVFNMLTCSLLKTSERTSAILLLSQPVFFHQTSLQPEVLKWSINCWLRGLPAGTQHHICNWSSCAARHLWRAMSLPSRCEFRLDLTQLLASEVHSRMPVMRLWCYQLLLPLVCS